MRALQGPTLRCCLVSSRQFVRLGKDITTDQLAFLSKSTDPLPVKLLGLLYVCIFSSTSLPPSSLKRFFLDVKATTKLSYLWVNSPRPQVETLRASFFSADFLLAADKMSREGLGAGPCREALGAGSVGAQVTHPAKPRDARFF